MRARLLGSFLGTAVLLCSSLASAQRVVVLEFSGDKQGKLRGQVERQLRSSGLHVVSLRQYKAVAAKKRLKGPQARTPAAVAEVSKVLKLDAAVMGSAGKSLRVRVVDSSGQQLSSSRFSLKRAMLKPADGPRLALAVSTSVGAVHAQAPAVPAHDERPAERKEEPAPPAPSEPEVDRTQREREEMAEAHTVPPPHRAEPVAKVEATRPSPGPTLFTAQVTGTTTWRSYCSRPGFSSCAQYNATDPTQRPPGDTVDFKAEVPYVGFSLAAELFPFAESRSLLRGLGLLAGYERAYSLTNVTILTSAGDTSQRSVYAVDQALSALLAFRYFFGMGFGETLPGYAGVHAGFGMRHFDVDANAQAPLPGSHRNYPVIGVEASAPLWSFLRVEGSGNYFINPKPIASEVANYGSAASGSGWGGELGLAGVVWGPLGYLVRVRYSHYKDQFSGSGAQWQTGGAAEESYLGVYWGASAHF